jgi:hypothetical protein
MPYEYLETKLEKRNPANFLLPCISSISFSFRWGWDGFQCNFSNLVDQAFDRNEAAKLLLCIRDRKTAVHTN